MGKAILFFVLYFTASHAFAGDIVSSIRAMAKKSEDYRNLSIDCFIEIKISKSQGWDSKHCKKYKEFALTDLQSFKKTFKSKTQELVNSSKNGELTKRRKIKGLKQLHIIESNMIGVDAIAKKIKSLLNT